MTAPAETTAGPNRRVIAIAAAGIVLILLLLLVPMLTGGGGDEESVTTTTVAVRATTTTTAAGGSTGAVTPVESFEIFELKNPFVPLRGTTSGTTTAGTGTSGTSGTTSSGSTSTSGSTSGGSSGGTTATTVAASGGSTAPRRGERVALLDVFAENGKVVANVRVASTVYKVSAGQTFATSYRVVSLDQGSSCGRFVFGDDTFRLCEGEETLK